MQFADSDDQEYIDDKENKNPLNNHFTPQRTRIQQQ